MSLVDVPEDLDEFYAWAVEQRWSDGFPVIPPTEERVDRMLAGTAWPADAVVGKIPPRLAECTVELIAANAVMAGCRPTAMPVLITAVQAMLEAPVNLYGAQATTHPCALMVLVTGPLAKAAGIHGGSGLFGPGFPANATIGRAVRLLQQNVGGAWPGESDNATHGSPAKFSFCFTENDDPADNPWEPYRISQGFGSGESTVTVVAAEGPHNLNDHVSNEPRGLLFTFAQTIASVGTNNAYCRDADFMLVLSPEHVKVLDDHGFTRREVQRYLFDRARIPYREWKLGGMFGMVPLHRHLEAADDDMLVPVVDTPDDVHVIVAGGPGRHSAWIPTFGITRMATKRMEGPDGSPL